MAVRRLNSIVFEEQTPEELTGAAELARRKLKRNNNDAESVDSFDHSSSNAVFNIASTQYANLMVMPLVIDTCLSRAPNVSIQACQISDADINDSTVRKLALGEFDLVLGHSRNHIPYLVTTPLISDCWVWVNAGDRSSEEESISVEEITSASVPRHSIFINDSEPHLRFKAQGKPYSSFSGVMDVMLNVANISGSRGCVPGLIAELYAKVYGLDVSPPIKTLPNIETWMYTHKKMSATPRRQFIKNIVEHHYREEVVNQ